MKWGRLSTYVVSGLTLTLLGTPLVAAALTVPLPSKHNFRDEIIRSLQSNPFSSDPRVAAAQDNNPFDSSGERGLKTFLINRAPCANPQDVLVYRIIVQSTDQSPQSVFTSFNMPPELTTVFSNPTPTNTAEGQLSWDLGTLNPGQIRQIDVSLQVTVPEITESLTVSTISFYADQRSATTSHTLDSCTDNSNTFSSESSPPPDKEPAIICHPADTTCQQALPSLGPNFDNAQNPSNQPTICSQHDPGNCTPNKPQLGARFAEAVADIEPGECSVAEDAIVASPAFHDAFIRRTNLSSYYLAPLFKSSRDFSQLIHENELAGLKHYGKVKTHLQQIHSRHWTERNQALTRVLRGELAPSSIRDQLASWEQNWRTETTQAQAELIQDFQDLQRQRISKYPPLADTATTNAESTLARACGPSAQIPLGPTLDQLGNQYEAELQARIDSYRQTAALFVNRDDSRYPPEYSSNWSTELQNALSAFEQGANQPLANFIQSIPTRDSGAFAFAWDISYSNWQDQEVASDNAFRLQQWETTFDQVKDAATQCETEKQFGPNVEVSWCESGSTPELLSAFARENAANSPKQLSPPSPADFDQSVIDETRVSGVSCRGQVGDPWWADDCSCNCNQLVPTREGNILFCQSVRSVTPTTELNPEATPSLTPNDPTITPIFLKPLEPFIGRLAHAAELAQITPEELSFFPSPTPVPSLTPTLEPSPTIPIITDQPRNRIRPITRHDIHITSFEECLAERLRHQDPFF